MPNGRHLKQHYKLTPKLVLIFIPSSITLGLMTFVPVSTRSGYVLGTRGVCADWPKQNMRHSIVLGQKQRYETAEIDAYNILDEHSLQIICAQQVTHSLFIL